MTEAVLTIMSDVMDTVAAPKTPLHEVWELMQKAKIQHVPVLEGDVLVGLVSSWDVAKAAMKHGAEEAKALTAKDVMEAGLERLHPKDDVERAVDLLCSGDFHSVPVVDDQEQLVGIVTTTDLLRRKTGR